MENSISPVIEIFSIHLKQGTSDAFHKAYIEQSLPLQAQWNVDILAFGPSLHDKDSYIVVRRYLDLVHRQQNQDSFYGSNDWKLGPRETILFYIESYMTVVIPVNNDLLEGLRLLNL